ncbi:penicillin acylase [Mucilaginibacter sp. PPCGB 2223]|uniref:penicillin acylase family protein n=1 Tax=Mucilaginibacter sp. PPCGB 2223 TaxID=1886027 RepID=UPI000826DFC9|nr:penicillin acylase family protein [Mucilaginibacter sp. PPCGB 2223]OCX51313.1 penicillin acylase [Mucilaginibacter sp. PPCGB 2223]
MKLTKAIISTLVTLLLIWALQTKHGDLPPLGKLLNPATGFWQNAESKNITANSSVKLKGLYGKIVIKYDENRIPHVFAENDHDLYFAQGYVTAADRLWQMDIQTRSASGRLSEIVGPKALELDRYHRRMGMVYGAENTLAECMKDPQVKEALEAYTAGVNAYIHNLPAKHYPLEFKLLDYAPEDFKPINCALVLKLMSETLAGGSDDFAMTNTLKLFGPKITNELFPDRAFKEEPVIPKGTKWNFKALPLPPASKGFIADMTDTIKTKPPVEGIGSNNWVVAGSRSANGYPILANDPHLDLSYPSIWYQIQLTAPGVNVYGVSIPGTPTVIIGYNQKIGWGVTNVDADVLDWYQVNFKDLSKNEYWYDGRWVPVKKRIEAIKIRGQATVYDTVLYTRQGPVVYQNASLKPSKLGAARIVPVGDALRWIAHDPSLEFKTFYLLNRGKNYDDYREALKYFSAPAQNFIFASVDKDIAITPNGKFPLKYRDQGKFILDGSDPADEWQGWIPPEQNPTVKNPAQGYLSSANQPSTDETYPYYINWRFASYQRAKRIDDRLGAMHKATADSLRALQNDNYSIFAQDILPTMIDGVDETKLDEKQKSVYRQIKNWNREYTAYNAGPTIFENWWANLYKAIWADDFAVKGALDVQLKWPSNYRTVQLLVTQQQSRWYDDTRTMGVETRDYLIQKTFEATVDSLYKHYGSPGKSWQWGVVKGSHISHLGKVEGLGSGEFDADGSGGVVNALSETHGPSWRMIVQFGPTVQGYGVFPGGESGNPGSFFYDNMFRTWKNGELNPLLFLQNPADQQKHITSTLTINNK